MRMAAESKKPTPLRQRINTNRQHTFRPRARPFICSSQSACVGDRGWVSFHSCTCRVRQLLKLPSSLSRTDGRCAAATFVSSSVRRSIERMNDPSDSEDPSSLCRRVLHGHLSRRRGGRARHGMDGTWLLNGGSLGRCCWWSAQWLL